MWLVMWGWESHYRKVIRSTFDSNSSCSEHMLSELKRMVTTVRRGLGRNWHRQPLFTPVTSLRRVNSEVSMSESSQISTKNKNSTVSGVASMWSAGSTDLFSNREIALLIELVEALPVLYAADKKLFKGIIPREKAWKIISEKLNRTGKWSIGDNGDAHRMYINR